MRNLLITLAGVLVGAGMIAGIAVALPRTTNVTVTQTSARAAMAMTGGMGSTMTSATATPATRKLMIQHVQRDCHVWSNGTTTATAMRLHLKQGQPLAILDMDVDAHQMLQFAGP